MESFILDSTSSLLQLAQKSGGKALNLARLSKNGLPVPNWFVLSIDFYERFLEHNKLQDKLNNLEGSFESIEANISKLFNESVFPDNLRHALVEAIKSRGLDNYFLAVRSSGLDEDSKDHSFAGQFSSYLYQKGQEAIENSVKQCFASAYSARGLAYRKKNGLNTQSLKVGVVIQKMVNADISGVAFSRNPIAPTDRDHLLISSAWGLCEGIVSGEISTDEITVNRSTLQHTIKITKKDHMIVQKESGGIKKIEVIPDRQLTPSLNETMISKLSKHLIQLENDFGCSQDVEWAIEKGELYFVQARPITTLPPDIFYDEKIMGSHYTLWDNSNIVESYSGVTSPLTFTFASFAYRQVYIQFHELMGVSREVINREETMYRNMLGLIRGRIYYSLINWYKLVLLLPGAASNSKFMETMMGVKQGLKPEVTTLFEALNNPPQYSLFKRINVHLHTVYRFLTMDKIIADFKKEFYLVYDKGMQIDFNKQSLTDIAEYYNHLEEKVLKNWKAPIINDYLVMIFFGILKSLTEKWIGAERKAELQNDLLCGEGDLESTGPTKMLMVMARKMDQGDQEFRNWFVKADMMTLRSDTRVKDLIKPFIDKYGFRCANELKLEEPDLYDDPTFALSSLQNFIRMKAYKIEEMEIREKEIRSKAETIVRESLSPKKAVIYWWILKEARRSVKNREDLRFMRTKIFGVCRKLFRATGNHFVKLGLIKEQQDVFYLTTEEIFSYIEGRTLTPNISFLVEHRKKEFQIYKDEVSPPDRFLTKGCVGFHLHFPSFIADSDLLKRDRRESDDPNTLYGTPCSPGVVEGVVRVCETVDDGKELNGEILVTYRTDPGWVPLYPACSGLLIERGSLLSHSAVVARELGLPTIVGIDGGLLKKLKTGDRVRMDAGSGEIKILR